MCIKNFHQLLCNLQNILDDIEHWMSRVEELYSRKGKVKAKKLLAMAQGLKEKQVHSSNIISRSVSNQLSYLHEIQHGEALTPPMLHVVTCALNYTMRCRMLHKLFPF